MSLLLAVAAEVWHRATTPQPPLEPPAVLAMAVLALVVVGTRHGHGIVRHGVTVLHEAGHALVAVLSGRRLTGIRLHADRSGLTLSRGRPRGPGMVATLLAGYPAPALAALAAAALLGRGYAAGVLWALVLLLAVLVLLVRNLYGLGLGLLLGGTLAAASWLLPPVALGWVAHLVVWTLLLAAPRAVLDLARAHGRGRGAGSDADQLRRLTGLPASLWVALFLVVAVGALLAGGIGLLGGR